MRRYPQESRTFPQCVENSVDNPFKIQNFQIKIPIAICQIPGDFPSVPPVDNPSKVANKYTPSPFFPRFQHPVSHSDTDFVTSTAEKSLHTAHFHRISKGFPQILIPFSMPSAQVTGREEPKKSICDNIYPVFHIFHAPYDFHYLSSLSCPSCLSRARAPLTPPTKSEVAYLHPLPMINFRI